MTCKNRLDAADNERSDNFRSFCKIEDPGLAQQHCGEGARGGVGGAHVVHRSFLKVGALHTVYLQNVAFYDFHFLTSVKFDFLTCTCVILAVFMRTRSWIRLDAPSTAVLGSDIESFPRSQANWYPRIMPEPHGNAEAYVRANEQQTFLPWNPPLERKLPGLGRR